MNKTSFRWAPLLAVLRIVLLVLLCVFFVFTALSAYVRYVLLDKSSYTAFADETAFVTKMTAFVREELEANCLFYDLPFSVLDAPLDEDTVRDYTRQYANELYNALAAGDAVTVPTVDAAPYVSSIKTFFYSLPEEERPLDSETAADTVGGELAANAQAALKAGFNESLLNVGHRLLGHPLIDRLADMVAVLAVITIAVLAACLAMDIRCLRPAFYNVSLSGLIGGIVIVVPFWLLRQYDLSARLAIMDSPMKLYIDGMLNSIVDGGLAIGWWCFLITAVLFLVAIAVCVWPAKTKK